MTVPQPLLRLRELLAGPGRRPAWRRRVLRKVAAAVLAVAAALALTTALRPPPPEPAAAVVVAARPLPAGAVLGPDDVRLATVAARLTGPRAPTDTAAVVGRALAGPVEDGEVLRPSRLVAPTSPGLGRGEVAVPVPLTSRVLARAVGVGSRVDVVAGGRVLAQDVPVLAMANPAPDASGGGDLPDSSGTDGTAELLVAVRRADAPAVASAGSDLSSPSAPFIILRPGHG